MSAQKWFSVKEKKKAGLVKRFSTTTLVIDRRGVEGAMRVAGDQRQTGIGVLSGNGPGIGAGGERIAQKLG